MRMCVVFFLESTKDQTFTTSIFQKIQNGDFVLAAPFMHFILSLFYICVLNNHALVINLRVLSGVLSLRFKYCPQKF